MALEVASTINLWVSWQRGDCRSGDEYLCAVINSYIYLGNFPTAGLQILAGTPKFECVPIRSFPFRTKRNLTAHTLKNSVHKLNALLNIQASGLQEAHGRQC